ncbi:MAG TPA: UbiD family decarboxylase [Candidatus Kapabacteria bacterium]|nr:UbiD family decarboxylase [Candidatus Kapabacteria bacterium]
MQKHKPLHSLKNFLHLLEREGELVRISLPVDPYLEASEIAVRAIRECKKAILFENVIGAKYPLAMNMLASDRRIELALGCGADELGAQLLNVAEQLMPPKPRGFFTSAMTLGKRLIAARARSVTNNRKEFAPNLSDLPVLQTWQDDAGKFITLPEVITYDLKTGKRNMGMYRMQLFDNATTGMHWQIQKGGGFHYNVAELFQKDLEVAVAVGTDPALLLATVAPLPEGIDEVMFAGFLRGEATRMTRARSLSIHVPAEAEFILEGIVPRQERRLEGPFGDHFGHYSHAGMFPVFHIKKITTRPDPIFTATVVGKPPMEDKWLGDATQKILSPLARLMHPEVKGIWAYYEAGFHNLLAISMKPRYGKEAMKTALSLVGEGQLSLTKCAVVVDENVNERNFMQVLRQIKDSFDPHYDLVILPRVPLDTLDFTSYTMNLGSKMIIDATTKLTATASGGSYPARQPNTYLLQTGTAEAELANIDNRIIEHRLIEDTLLVVKVRGEYTTAENAAKKLESEFTAPNETNGSEVIKRLIDRGTVRYLPKGTKIVAAVSEDVDLTNDMEVLWGIFTRFDAARDVFFTSSHLERTVPIYEGIMGIDATWKRGYPNPCIQDESIVRRVDERWGSYGF